MRVLCIVQTTAHPAELRRHQATGLPHIHHAERQEVGEGNRRRVHSPPSRIVRFATFTSLYTAVPRRVRHSAHQLCICACEGSVGGKPSALGKNCLHAYRTVYRKRECISKYDSGGDRRRGCMAGTAGGASWV
jgi:hypothetical protein